MSDKEKELQELPPLEDVTSIIGVEALQIGNRYLVADKWEGILTTIANYTRFSVFTLEAENGTKYLLSGFSKFDLIPHKDESTIKLSVEESMHEAILHVWSKLGCISSITLGEEERALYMAKVAYVNKLEKFYNDLLNPNVNKTV